MHCVRAGLHEFGEGQKVEPFDIGDELPGGVVAHDVGAICPDETALHIPALQALALADGAVRWEPGGPLAFVPDKFMDDPEETKAVSARPTDGWRDSTSAISCSHTASRSLETGREALADFAALTRRSEVFSATLRTPGKL